MADMTRIATALEALNGSTETRKLLKHTAPRNLDRAVVAAIMRRLTGLNFECHEDLQTGDVYARGRFTFVDVEYANQAVFRYPTLDSGDIQSSIEHIVRTVCYLDSTTWLGLAVAYGDEAMDRDRASDHVYDAMQYVNNPQVVIK